MENNQVTILRKTIKSLSKERLVDPYKIARFKHQLELAFIKERLDGKIT